MKKEIRTSSSVLLNKDMDNKLPSSDKKTYSPEKAKSDPDSALAQRPAKEHTFLTDVADVRVMEQGLLHLLDDFHSGKLEAFGGMSTYEKMDQIREQQEQLAHLHFELDLQQDMRRLDSEEARKRNNANLKRLIDKLSSLSSSIQQLEKRPGYEHRPKLF